MGNAEKLPGSGDIFEKIVHTEPAETWQTPVAESAETLAELPVATNELRRVEDGGADSAEPDLELEGGA